MKRPMMSLAPMLALVWGVGCQAPQQDRAEPDSFEQPTTRSDEGVQDTANDFVSEAREALNDLSARFQQLEERNDELQGESAAAWARVREEIAQAGERVETDLNALGTAAAKGADEVRLRVARNIETVTHRVERAELLAADGSEEFVSAARERLAEIDQDIQSLEAEAAQLPLEAREAASEAVKTLRTEANDVRVAVTSIADAAPQVIAEQREELAEDVATLFASVRRESFELQADLVG